MPVVANRAHDADEASAVGECAALADDGALHDSLPVGEGTSTTSVEVDMRTRQGVRRSRPSGRLQNTSAAVPQFGQGFSASVYAVQIGPVLIADQFCSPRSCTTDTNPCRNRRVRAGRTRTVVVGLPFDPIHRLHRLQRHFRCSEDRVRSNLVIL